MSDLFDFWRYTSSLPIEDRFTYIIDDKTLEDISPEQDCPVIDLGMGLGCEYIQIKGVAKSERVAKIAHYAGYFKQQQKWYHNTLTQ